MHLAGIVSYLVFFFSTAGIYAVLALGLNVQWGFTGQTNIGVAGFFAIGAYVTAILSTPPDPSHLGGLGLPFIVSVLTAMVACGIIALLIGIITLNLRGDYLAIATIGIAETLRLYLTNAQNVTGGVRGIPGIPRPFPDVGPGGNSILFLALVIVIVAIVWIAFARLYRSPWVRVLRALRSNEDAALAAGKNVLRFRIEAFVVGAIAMGVAGVLYATFTRFVSPEAFDPMYGTFLVWVMLIAGGSGNNLGATGGAVIVWAIWSATDYLASLLPSAWDTRAAAIRVFLIGLILEVVLILRPQGIFPEKPPKPIEPEPGLEPAGVAPGSDPDASNSAATRDDEEE